MKERMETDKMHREREGRRKKEIVQDLAAVAEAVKLLFFFLLLILKTTLPSSPNLMIGAPPLLDLKVPTHPLVAIRNSMWITITLFLF